MSPLHQPLPVARPTHSNGVWGGKAEDREPVAFSITGVTPEQKFYLDHSVVCVEQAVVNHESGDHAGMYGNRNLKPGKVMVRFRMRGGLAGNWFDPDDENLTFGKVCRFALPS